MKTSVMLRAIHLGFVAVILGGLIAIPQTAFATATLAGVLDEFHGLSKEQRDAVRDWARSGAKPPAHWGFEPQTTEAAISNLSSGDRDAILAWLRSRDRSKLHALGVTDTQIDQPRATPTPVPTPNPWRVLPVASQTLDANVQGNITLLNAFAAAKIDGTGAIACVSFKNVDARTASRIVFEFPLLDRAGREIGKLTLDRKGTFSPNINIMGMTSVGGGVGGRGLRDNCIDQEMQVAALPVLRARAASYRITRVEYTDGTFWNATP